MANAGQDGPGDAGSSGQGNPAPLGHKDWIGVAGSLLAILLSVIGLNKQPLFRGWAVALMLLAAGVGVLAIAVRRYRRVTTSAAVVLVVASLAILIAAPDPVEPGPAPSPTPGPRLLISKVDVIAPDGAGSVAVLDVTVRNDGDRPAVLTELDLVIDAFGYLPPCLFGSNLEVTGTYAATLPDNPGPAEVVAVSLHQQVEPGAVDRFTVGLKAPDGHPGDDLGAIASYVYAGSVRLQQDAAGTAPDAVPVVIDAGSALDANGTFYFGAARNATAADVGTGGLCSGESGCVNQQVACWNANRATLLPLLGKPGNRSPGARAATTALGKA
jgi:hypothetical protein